MNEFTHDELTLMSIYNSAGTRQGLINELNEMRTYLATDEKRLRNLTDSAVEKLTVMSDVEFENIVGELVSDFYE